MNQLEKDKRKEIVDLHLILEEKRNQLINDLEETCKELTDLGLPTKFDPDNQKIYFNL